MWLCLSACSGDAARSVPETYDYVLTPSGQRFRVIAAGPVLRGANTRLGLRISYVAQARDEPELIAHADALVAAFGPELQLTGDRKLVVRARLGAPTHQLPGPGAASYDVAYVLGPGGFVRDREAQAHAPPELAAVSGKGDPEFPYAADKLSAAAAAGAEWLAALDRADLAVTREQMTQTFRAQVADDERYRELLLLRQQAGLPGMRSELYRMQQRTKRAPGDDILLVYVCASPGLPRVVERVVMVREAGVWRASGYVFQPLQR